MIALPYMQLSRIDNMRTIRECMHCGREFQSLKDEFCSFNCASEAST